jgi:hypothetical protein
MKLLKIESQLIDIEENEIVDDMGKSGYVDQNEIVEDRGSIDGC